MKIDSEYIKCYLSEIGHNNFWYPSATQAIMLLNCDHAKLAWISGSKRSLTAVKVRKSCVLPLSYARKAAKKIDPSAEGDYTVVWINK